jgi:hypothetical protein
MAQSSLERRAESISSKISQALTPDASGNLDTSAIDIEQNVRWLIDAANGIRDKDGDGEGKVKDYITSAPIYMFLYTQGQIYKDKERIHLIDRDPKLVLQFATAANLFAECMWQVSQLDIASDVLKEAIKWCEDSGLVHYGLNCINSRILVESAKALNYSTDDAISAINRSIVSLLQRQPVLEDGASSDSQEEQKKFKRTKARVQNNLGVLYTRMAKLRNSEDNLDNAERYLHDSLITTQTLDRNDKDRSTNIVMINSNFAHVYIERATHILNQARIGKKPNSDIFYNYLDLARNYLNISANAYVSKVKGFGAELNTRRALILTLFVYALDNNITPPINFVREMKPTHEILLEAAKLVGTASDMSADVEDDAELNETKNLLAPLMLKYIGN